MIKDRTILWMLIIFGFLLVITILTGCGDYPEGASTTDILLCEIANIGDGGECVERRTEMRDEKTRPAWDRKPFLLVTWRGGPDYIYYKECNASHVREMKHGKYRDQDQSITGWKRWIKEKDARWHVRNHDAVLHPDCDHTETCSRILNRLD